MKRLYRIPKFKNKPGRNGYVISNPDSSPIIAKAIRLIKVEGNNHIAVEIEYDEKFEDASVGNQGK